MVEKQRGSGEEGDERRVLEQSSYRFADAARQDPDHATSNNCERSRKCEITTAPASACAPYSLCARPSPDSSAVSPRASGALTSCLSPDRTSASASWDLLGGRASEPGIPSQPLMLPSIRNPRCTGDCLPSHAARLNRALKLWSRSLIPGSRRSDNKVVEN